MNKEMLMTSQLSNQHELQYKIVPGQQGKNIITYIKNWSEDFKTKQKQPASTTYPSINPQENKLTTIPEKPTVVELFKNKKPITLADLEQAALAKQKLQLNLKYEKPSVEEVVDNSSNPETPVSETLQSNISYNPIDVFGKTDDNTSNDATNKTTSNLSDDTTSNLSDDTTSNLSDDISNDVSSNVPIDNDISCFIDVTSANETRENRIKRLEPFPPLTLLNTIKNSDDASEDEVFAKANLLEQTLANFGVQASVTDFTRGPTITRFEIQPALGVKVSKIVNLADDLALSMAATDIRIEAPIPGKAAVGIEIPNSKKTAVVMRQVIDTSQFIQHQSKLSVALGVNIAGEPVIADLATMPHLLIAGSTGSGKSVCMNSLITSILMKATPDEVKFLMIDPKMVELSTYNGIPHLIAPVVTDARKATIALKWIVKEMETRYALFAEAKTKNITSYNELQIADDKAPLPYIAVLIDELADLMMVASKEVEEVICRLAQMARAAGIHLVIATQRPSVDVITGIIKANIPSRIAFAVSSQADSRTILDLAGAEKLLGRGDMLFNPIGLSKPMRVQGAFVSEDEVNKIVSHWKAQATPEYITGIFDLDTSNNNNNGYESEDELLPDAAKLLVENGQASVSMLQRRFRIGYNRAARIIDQLEAKGVVGPFEGSKARTVLIDNNDLENIF